MYAYAEVVLPLKLRTSFTYTIPEAMQDAVVAGVRVLVSFGANKFYAGMVLSCHNQVPSYTSIKPILEVLDQNPILHKPQIQLWQWMSKYYMSNLGEIMDAALPNAFKLSSERIYQIKPNSNWQEIPLDTDAQMLADAIASQGHLKSKEVQTFFEKK
jgi:primosomal protein N' (replication factor Y)